jgi:hypothetical protein
MRLLCFCWYSYLRVYLFTFGFGGLPLRRQWVWAKEKENVKLIRMMKIRWDRMCDLIRDTIGWDKNTPSSSLSKSGSYLISSCCFWIWEWKIRCSSSSLYTPNPKGCLITRYFFAYLFNNLHSNEVTSSKSDDEFFYFGFSFPASNFSLAL